MLVLRNKKPIRKIGGIYCFKANTSNEIIIEHILRDFALKLYGIMKEYYDPRVGCSSLCTYEIFDKHWGLDDPGDVSSTGQEIYSEIPSEKVAGYIRELDPNFSKETVRRSFDGGEFPIIKIWKGYHEGRNEIHVTYHICR